jgi:hypothetical protein
MSTLTVDDELYRQATEAAVAQGQTVDEFVGEALRQALSIDGFNAATSRSGRLAPGIRP